MAYNFHVTWVVAGWLRTYWPFGTPSLKHYNRQILLLYRTRMSDYFMVLNWCLYMSVSWTIIHNYTFSCMGQFFWASFLQPLNRHTANVLMRLWLFYITWVFKHHKDEYFLFFFQDDCLITNDVNASLVMMRLCPHQCQSRSHWLPSVDRGRSRIKQMLSSWWR